MSDRSVSRPPALTFPDRHIGPDPAERAAMLETVGYASTADLMTAALPADILTAPDAPAPLRLPEPVGRPRCSRNCGLLPPATACWSP